MRDLQYFERLSNKLLEENNRLKELLKQCKEYLDSINPDSDEDSEINDLIFCIKNEVDDD